jgi:16S rRNA (guanine1516-N2)-methyltransferase
LTGINTHNNSVFKGLKGLPFLVTTTLLPTDQQIKEAQIIADKYRLTYKQREKSLHRCYESTANPVLTGILIVGKTEYKFWSPNGSVFSYHPGMAVHRIKGLSLGHPDPMVTAMGLKPGDHVLDATAGLCSDALVTQYVVGQKGTVTALESSLPIALVVIKGLENYQFQGKAVMECMRQINLLCTDYTEYLSQAAPAGWDIVYFDPMFSKPVLTSSGIDPLRKLADYSPLDLKGLILAARCAKRAVVVKDRLGGPYYTSKIFSYTHTGSSDRRIGYAVLTGDNLHKLAERSIDNE